MARDLLGHFILWVLWYKHIQPKIMAESGTPSAENFAAEGAERAPPPIARGRVTLDPPPPKKSRHVRSPAQQEALKTCREKAHSMLRGSKWVVDEGLPETPHEPQAPVPTAPQGSPAPHAQHGSPSPASDHIDRRMAELLTLTRLQLENERLVRKVEKHRMARLGESKGLAGPVPQSQPPLHSAAESRHTSSPYESLILAEIKRMACR